MNGKKEMRKANMVLAVTMINSSPEDRRELRRNYSRHIYSGCGKSLSCKDICPRGIDTEKLLVRSNAVLLWGKRKSGRP